MLLADSRFTQESKLSKLPKWIQQRIEKGNVGLSIEMAMNVTKYFFKEMAQKSNSFETSLVEEKNVKNFLKK
ncbi:DNA repair helicase rad3 [Ecytonucleospora hepatopenaei]|uniref:DNA repair helicase rad3 n=1 Tax=Ecytonucleospora hepatopenaei TaxID=646526 RepID=A0A1W0E619_9MICR|nr:DNA repair helicase rad3 [Ecytonucleospora hepatopenaei]